MSNTRQPGHNPKTPSLFQPAPVVEPDSSSVSGRARASVMPDYKHLEIRKKLQGLILSTGVSLQKLQHRATDEITHTDYESSKATFAKLADHFEPTLQQLKTAVEKYTDAELLKNEDSIYSKLMPIVESVRHHGMMLENILIDQLDAKRKVAFKK